MVHNDQDVRENQMLINKWMGKENMIEVRCGESSWHSQQPKIDNGKISSLRDNLCIFFKKKIQPLIPALRRQKQAISVSSRLA